MCHGQASIILISKGSPFNAIGDFSFLCIGFSLKHFKHFSLLVFRYDLYYQQRTHTQLKQNWDGPILIVYLKDNHFAHGCLLVVAMT